MTQQVLYDTSTDLVIQWQDTDALSYPATPAGAAILPVTAVQWEAGVSTPGYSVQNGALVSPAPPAPPTAEQQLAQQAALAQGSGLTIALSGTMTLAETLFPTDLATQDKLAAVTTTLNATGAFPGGATSYPMKDASGAWHTFTVSQYKAAAGAIAAYVAAIDLIVDGNPFGATALPSSSVSLTV